ncbi:MAG: phosphatidate cytidylyltransferase [Gammaproteobacteria bacterium]
MLKQRIITGIIYVAIIVAAVLKLPEFGFSIFAAAICTGCFLEWMRLAGVTTLIQKIIWTDLFIIGMFLTYWSPMMQWGLLATACFVWSGIMAWLVACQAMNRITPLSTRVIMILSFFTLLPLFSGLLVLREMPQGSLLVMMVFVLVWCSDTFAFIVGKAIGRHKIAPLLSPGKTVEGLLGAMVLTVFAMWAYYVFVLKQPYQSGLIGMVVIAVLLSAVGDFFESALKRIRGVKDSGAILPGHGGLLDRLDSLIALTPCLAFGLLRAFE